MRITCVILAVAVSLIISSCSSHRKIVNNPPTKTPINDTPIVVSENVTVITKDNINIIDQSSTSNLVVIENTMVSSIDIVTGNVIVIDQSDVYPDGALKKVTGWKVSGNQTLYDVENAALAEVLEEGRMSFEVDLDYSQMIRNQPHPNLRIQEAVDIQKSIRIVLDDYPLFEKKGIDINVTGYIDFIPKLFFDYSFDGFKLKMLIFKINLQQSSFVEVKSNQQINIDKVIQIGKTFYFKKIFKTIGAVPVIIQPTLKLFLTLKGNTTTSLKVGVKGSSDLNAEIRYEESGFFFDKSLEKSKILESFSIPTVNAELETFLGPEVGLKIYGIECPRINISGLIDYEGSNSKNPFLTIDTGIKAKGHVDFSMLDKTIPAYEKELLRKTTNLLTLRLEKPKDIKIDTLNTNTMLEWNKVNYASKYNLYWRKDSSLDSNFQVVKNIEGTHYEHDNLEPGKYYYQVSAIRGKIESDLSSPVNGEIFEKPPLQLEPPNIVKISSNNTEVLVEWNNTFQASHYNLYWNNGPQIDKHNAQIIQGIKTTSYLHTNLDPGKYYYRVSAVSGNVKSKLSALANTEIFEKELPKPKPPEEINISSSNTTIHLEWNKVTNVSKYNLYWSNTPHQIDKINAQIIQDIDATNYAHTNLKSGSYFYSISSVSKNIESELSHVIGTEIINLEPPKNIKISSNNTEIILEWDSAQYALKYNLYWSNDPPLDKSNAQIIKDIEELAYTHKDLEPGKYYYRLSSVSGNIESELSGSVDIELFKKEPIKLDPPNTINISSSNTEVFLDWNEVNNASSYNLYWGNSSQLDKSNGQVIQGIDKTSFTHSSLDPGKYYYRISAVTGNIESDLSHLVDIEIFEEISFKNVQIKMTVQGDKMLPEKWQDNWESNVAVLNLHIKDSTGSLYLAYDDESGPISGDSISYFFDSDSYKHKTASINYKVQGNLMVGVAYLIDELLCCIADSPEQYPAEYGGAEAKIDIIMDGKTQTFTQPLPHPGTTWILGEIDPIAGTITTSNVLSVPDIPEFTYPSNKPIF